MMPGALRRTATCLSLRIRCRQGHHWIEFTRHSLLNHDLGPQSKRTISFSPLPKSDSRRTLHGLHSEIFGVPKDGGMGKQQQTFPGEQEFVYKQRVHLAGNTNATGFCDAGTESEDLVKSCRDEDTRTFGGTELDSEVYGPENNGGSELPFKEVTDDKSELEEGLEEESSLSEDDIVLMKAEDGEEGKELTEKVLVGRVGKGPGIGTKIELLPKVMLVGRPNVGKSALFNRLTKRREALVYNTPDGHVTRDVREGVAKIGDLRFIVYDTAGLETEADPESILVRTAGITSAALSECHMALFLIDGRAGLHPLDTEVGKWLRKQTPPVPVILVMNKAEGIYEETTGMLLASLGEAHSLGFGDPIAISAESGEGLSDLYEALQAVLEQAAARIIATQEFRLDDECEDSSLHGSVEIPMQLAIAGRPNVGKSTILNSLLRQERVLTGPEPGLTRDAVRVKFDYDGRTIYLVDTAGWMQRMQVKQGPAALSAMHARRSLMRAHIVALVLDGEEVAKSKKSMRSSEAALARWVTQEGRGLVVVVNKMDLLKGKEHSDLRIKVMKAVPEEISTILPQVMGVPIVFVSALEGKGGAAIMRKVFESYERWNVRLPTARLNNWLQKVLNRHPRRGEGGYGAKMRYITQVKARPPTFVVFVTGSGQLEETDLRFLASALREDFNLGGIPIRIVPRHTRKGLKGAESLSLKAKKHSKNQNPKSQTLPSLKRNTV